MHPTTGLHHVKNGLKMADEETVYRYAQEKLGLTSLEAYHLFTPNRRISGDYASVTPQRAAQALRRAADRSDAGETFDSHIWKP